MQTIRRLMSPVSLSACGLVLLGLFSVGMTSCRYPSTDAAPVEPQLDPGWPKGNDFFHEAAYGTAPVAIPEIPGAEYVNDDELCMTCHEAYTKQFANNVHRNGKCESCHGPASRHLVTRGKEPGLILSFKTMHPAEAAEACLKCHEDDACSPGAQWRFSRHAECGVTCTDCHISHYNVPEGTPATTEPGEAALNLDEEEWQPLVRGQDPGDLPSLAGTSNNLGAVAPYTCYRCHQDHQQYENIAGPHQILGPNGFNCTTCHDAHGRIYEESRKDLCLECHDKGSPTMAYHSSTHDLEGVA